jgi:hypothetical protein
MTDANEIPGHRAALRYRARMAQAVRIYCFAQKDAWQTLPLLALAATDLTQPLPDPNYLNLSRMPDRLRLTYAFGFWPVAATTDEWQRPKVYVDLASGWLINVGLVHARQEIECADNNTVGPLAFCLEVLDVAVIEQRLSEEAQRLRLAKPDVVARQRALRREVELSPSYLEREKWPPNRWPPPLEY